MRRALKQAKKLVALGCYSIENPAIYSDLDQLGISPTEVPDAIAAVFLEIGEGDSRPAREFNDPPAHQFIWNSEFFERKMLVKFSLKGRRPNCQLWGLHPPVYRG